MRRIRLSLLTFLAALAAAPAAAPAAVFRGDPVDGPSADIVSLGDVDLSRDANGALAYVKRDGGVEHIFVSRFLAGTFVTPERLDGPLTTPSANPAVAAGNNGRTAVVFSSGGALYGVIRTAKDQPWSAPTLIAPVGDRPAIDMSINGTAYVAFVENTDVRVARLDRRTNVWALLPVAADINQAAIAGAGDRRPRVAVSADGVGLVTWGEEGPDGRTHVFARKAFGTNLSAQPQDLTLDAFEGKGAGAATQPDVDAEDDSSFGWVTFRQEVGGVSRVFGRRQRGTQFDDAVAIDDAEGAQEPRIDISGRGIGLAGMSSAASKQAVGGVLMDDKWGVGSGRSGAAGALVGPVIPAMSENSDGFLAWAQAATGPPEVRIRPFDNGKPLDEPVVSKPELGPVDTSLGFDAAIDRANSGVVTYVQGQGADRKIVAAYVDRAPLAFAGYTSQRFRNAVRPNLSWQAAFDLFGAVRYQVLVDDQPVGETTDTKLVPVQPIPDGQHRWRVIATDLRGQTKSSKTRLLRVDATPPRLTVNKRKGVLSATASDVQTPTASGINYIRFTLPDGRTRTIKGQAGRVRAPKRGAVRVSAFDKAGNFVVRSR